MKNAWSWFGYHEGVHYVIGKRPPKHFTRPYQGPETFKNVITWWNGTTVILGSFDRPQLMRGGSNDWVIVDEALLINKDSYDQVIIPTLRGSDIRLQGKKGHLSEEFTSSMPYGAHGAWLLDKEIEAQNPVNDTFYIEGTSYHNRIILTDKVLRKWKRTMNPIHYLIEVMNERIKNFGSIFYPSFNAKVHTYFDGYNYDYIDKLGYNIHSKKHDSRWDKDCNPTIPLHLSWDFGAFNCVTIDQEVWPHRNWLNYMHASHPDTLDDLIDRVADYYEHHQNKTIFLWGDRWGNKKETNSKLTLFQTIATRLRAKKWRVIQKTAAYVEHLERHRFIIDLFNEKDDRYLKNRFNSNNCKDLIIAIESAGMKDDRKDKRSENNPNVKQEHATHGTDAVDYRLYWAEKAKEKQTAPQSTAVSFGS